MPIIKSAKKRVKQTIKRRDRNYLTRTALKKSIRSVTDLVKTGKKPDAEKALQKAYKTIDTATKKNILHPNTAARRKSSLAKQIKAL